MSIGPLYFTVTSSFIDTLVSEGAFKLQTDVIIKIGWEVEFITHTPDFTFCRRTVHDINDMIISFSVIPSFSRVIISFNFDNKLIKRFKHIESLYSIFKIEYKMIDDSAVCDSLVIESKLLDGQNSTLDIVVNQNPDLIAIKKVKEANNPLFSCKINPVVITLLRSVKAVDFEVYSENANSSDVLLLTVGGVDVLINTDVSIHHKGEINVTIVGAVLKLTANIEYMLQVYDNLAIFTELLSGTDNIFTNINIIKS